MTAWLGAPMAVAAALGLMATVQTIRRRRVGWVLLIGGGILELILITQLIIGLVAAASASAELDRVLFAGYLIGCLPIPPAAFLWGLSDSSRWGTGAVAVGLVTVAFLGLRLVQIWQG